MGAFVSKLFSILQPTWFSLTLTLGCIFAWANGLILRYTPFLFRDQAYRQKVTCICVKVWFRLAFLLNPWIRVDTSQVDWNLIMNQTSLMLINHNSFLDALIIIAFSPCRVMATLRTLLKASLLKLPFFGTLSNLCGNFPVYFRGSKQGDFSVDKEKQARIMESVAEHISRGGNLAVFPEGQVSKDPMKGLQDFRYGSFKLARQHGLPLFGLAMKGCEQIWPKASSFGGFAGTVELKLFPIVKDQKEVSDMSIPQLAKMARSTFMSHLNRMHQDNPDWQPKDEKEDDTKIERNGKSDPEIDTGLSSGEYNEQDQNTDYKVKRQELANSRESDK